MRRAPLLIALLSACSGVYETPPGAARATAPPIARREAAPPASSTVSASERVLPAQPTVSATTDSESSAQWTLEARDFPAISRNGQLVALASGELHTTGPPVLALTLEFRSIDSGRKLRTKSFRHPYTGELPAAELGSLRKRLSEWVNRENAALASADLIPIPPLEQRDPCAAEDDVVQKITAPPLDVSLEKTRLVVRQHGRVFVDRDHASWMVADNRNPFGNCRYRPVLTGVFVDGARRALVVRADYCSPGDSCAEGVPPRFSVQRLPQ